MIDWVVGKKLGQRGRFPVGRPPAGEAGQRTGHLLDVAWEAFIELGYEGASVAEIARRAGASKQTIYSRFATKAELFKAVIRRGTDQLHELMACILEPEEAVEKVLQNYGENLMEIVLEPETQRFLRMVVGASNNFPELAEFFWQRGPFRAKEMLADYLVRQAAKGELKISDPILAANVFDSLCTGSVPLMATIGLPVPSDKAGLRRVVREAVRVFLAAYVLPKRGRR